MDFINELPSKKEIAEFLVDRYQKGFILTIEELRKIAYRMNLAHLIDWKTIKIIKEQ